MDKKLQTTAWRCLPKEFKEEVKNQYRDGFNDDRKAIGRLFGIDNLLSDAEGDDEMLCVSRKDMQFYYQYYKIKRESEPSAEQKAYYKGRTKVLLDLFGSKCLPDEGTDCTPVEVGVAENATTSNVDSPEANVDSSHGNVESLEPKPAEPKFHVGQRVRCLNDGETYIVLAKVGKHHYSLQGVEHDVHEDYLEPYTEPTDLNKSSETCTDDCSSPDHFVVKDEMVDNIIKDGFKNHNRLNIAAMAMQGILSNIDLFKNVLETGMETLGGDGISFRAVAKSSFLFADALINEAEEGDSK